MANLLEEIGQNLRIAGGVSSPQVAEENSRRRQQFEQVKEQRAQLILQMGARAVESGAMTPEKFQLLAQKYGGGDMQLAGPSVATQKTQADMVAEQAKTQKANQLRAAYEQELSKYENPPPVTTPEGATVVEGKRTLIDDYMRRSELATRFGQDDEAKRWRELANTEINAQKLTQEKTGRNVQFVELPTGKTVNGKPEFQNYAVVGRNEDGTPKLVAQGKPAPKGSLVDVNNQLFAPQPGVDAEGNPVFFQPSKGGGVPTIVPGVTPKAPEGYSKQKSGINSVVDSMESYKKALTNIGGRLDRLTPSKRLELGTQYNNLMLQAKEAFNLGVLNGPDYMILQQVIKNPLDATSLIYSAEDLKKQVDVFNEVMGRVRQSIDRSYGQGSAVEAPEVKGLKTETIPEGKGIDWNEADEKRLNELEQKKNRGYKK